MGNLHQNRYVVGTALALLLYGVICATVPAMWLTGFVSAALLITSVIVFGLYLPDAFDVIKRGETGDGEFALLAITAISGGAAMAGLFGLVWTLVGQPPSWLGTWFSNFGRAAMVPGFILFMLSPNATREQVVLPPWYLLLPGAIGVAIIGFFFGAQFRIEEYAELLHRAAQ